MSTFNGRKNSYEIGKTAKSQRIVKILRNKKKLFFFPKLFNWTPKKSKKKSWIPKNGSTQSGGHSIRNPIMRTKLRKNSQTRPFFYFIFLEFLGFVTNSRDGDLFTKCFAPTSWDEHFSKLFFKIIIGILFYWKKKYFHINAAR